MELNHYEIEQRLFTLLVEAIEKENPNPDAGIEQLLSVLHVHVENLNRQSKGRFPDFTEYEAALEAAFICSELIEALLENHPEDATNEESQAGRMVSLLTDVRHDLESICWDVEESMPDLEAMFQLARTRIATTIH